MRVVVWAVTTGRPQVYLVGSLSDDHQQLVVDTDANSVMWSIAESRRYIDVPPGSFVWGLRMVGPLIRGIDWLRGHRDVIRPNRERSYDEVLSFCEMYLATAMTPDTRIYVELGY